MKQEREREKKVIIVWCWAKYPPYEDGICVCVCVCQWRITSESMAQSKGKQQMKKSVDKLNETLVRSRAHRELQSVAGVCTNWWIAICIHRLQHCGSLFGSVFECVIIYIIIIDANMYANLCVLPARKNGYKTARFIAMVIHSVVRHLPVIDCLTYNIVLFANRKELDIELW